MASERLYGTNDMARALGVSTTALINRRARNGPREIVPPEPAYIHGRKDSPLWTRAQVEAILAERISYAEKVLDGEKEA